VFLLFSMGLLVMAQTVEIVAQERKDYGTRVARRLRKGGQVPGVVYGHKEATVFRQRFRRRIVERDPAWRPHHRPQAG